jgi:hypothetical protein
MSQMEWMSLREFSRRCGRKHRAAQQAIEDGRIPKECVRRGESGRIIAVEYYQASACWRANTFDTSLRPPIAAGRPAVQTSGRKDPALPDRIGVVLGQAFANSLLAACATSIWRHCLTPGQALDVHEDTLMAVMFAVSDVLQLDAEDDRPKVLFRDELRDALDPSRRGALLERIQLVADQFAKDQAAAKAAGEFQ